MQARPGKHLFIPENRLPAKLAFPRRPMNDDEYYKFCMANPDLVFERTAEGEIVIVPPAGGESSYQSGDANRQLANWAVRSRRGKTFDSSVEFILPTGAAFSPDAAWVSNGRIMQLSKDQRRKFLPLAPEFIIEVMSPSDRLKDVKKKMEEWMRGGVELGWLIQADRKTVYIYGAGDAEPEKRTGIKKLTGQGPVAGFELDLTEIGSGCRPRSRRVPPRQRPPIGTGGVVNHFSRQANEADEHATARLLMLRCGARCVSARA